MCVRSSSCVECVVCTTIAKVDEAGVNLLFYVDGLPYAFCKVMLIIFAYDNIQSSRLQILHFIIYGAQWRVLHLTWWCAKSGVRLEL